jgi:hydroxyacylglutathione hydrolase
MDLLSIAETKSLLADGAWLIDARPSAIFIQGFIPGSVHIPYGDNFTAYLELLLEPGIKAILLAESGQENNIARHAIKTGFVNLAGAIDGGYEAWVAAGGKKDIIIDIGLEEFELDFNYDEFYLIDLRTEDQYDKGHLEHAESLPLSDIADYIADLQADNMYYLYGHSFEDAAFAASLFRRSGFYKLRIVNQGYEAFKDTKIPVVKKKNPKTDPNFSAN